MFHLGAWEITMILIAALLLLGPQKLPEFASWIGKVMREIRKVTQEVRTAIDFEMEKQELDRLKEELSPDLEPLLKSINEPLESVNDALAENSGYTSQDSTIDIPKEDEPSQVESPVASKTETPSTETNTASTAAKASS